MARCHYVAGRAARYRDTEPRCPYSPGTMARKDWLKGKGDMAMALKYWHLNNPARLLRLIGQPGSIEGMANLIERKRIRGGSRL